MCLVAALLADTGFVTLALAIIGFDDLPKNMLRLEVEYFEEAIDFLSQLDCVQPGGIGAVGLSKGADLMVEMAILTPRLTAVAFINGFCHPRLGNLYWKDELYREMISPDISKLSFDEENFLVTTDMFLPDDEPVSRQVQVERIHGKIAFFASGADRNVPAVPGALALQQRMLAAGRSEDCQLHIFEDAGHILDPAYMPHCSGQYFQNFNRSVVSFGGVPAKHHEAQLRFWPLLIRFLRRNTGNSFAELS